MAVAKRAANRRRRGPQRTTRELQPVSDNDHISILLGDIVPEEYRRNGKFVDIITWNIRYFNVRDPERVALIGRIMGQLNADIFVLEEIEDLAMEPVVEYLTQSGAGLYKFRNGTTGGDQRVVFVYDTEWIKAKEDIVELFADRNELPGNSKAKIFPRLPLFGNFVAQIPPDMTPRNGLPAFDFNLLGVHLKSQRGGGQEQRTLAAERLADWTTNETSDEDVLIAGDWNAPANRPEWAPIRALERGNKVRFAAFNPEREPSHFMKGGRNSRLDYIMVSEAAAKVAHDRDQGTKVVPWSFLDGSSRITNVAIDKISDHRPVLARFYWVDSDD